MHTRHRFRMLPPQAVRSPLSQAAVGLQLVESLLPMWEEERGRCGGRVPGRPPSPPRNPRPLCPAVDAVRVELQVTV